MRKIYRGKRYDAGWENGLFAGHRLLVQILRSYLTHAIDDKSTDYKAGYKQAVQDAIQHVNTFADAKQDLECTCGACESEI